MASGTVRKQEEEDNAPVFVQVQMEIYRQLWIAFPMMGVNLLQFSVQLVAIMFVGHLGELDLSSASIATSFCNVTGFSVMVGLANALETLCGQAYGAKQYRMLGIFLQRAIFVLAILSFLVAFLFYRMEDILLLFGQAPDISHKAGIYARYLIPGLIAHVFIQPLLRFLQTQSCVIPMFLCSTVTLLCQLPLCWLFVQKLELKAQGAALSISICFWLNAVLLVLLVAYVPRCRHCWPGFSSEIFQDVGVFLKLAVPSAVMLCFEWWTFEILVLLSGVMPNPQLETSVYSIILNTISYTYMIPKSIGAAASTRISNELGAGNVSRARFAFYVTTGLAVIDATMVATALFFLRHLIGKTYSNEPEVIDYVAELGPIIALVSFMDDIQGSISGVARGCGWQATAASINFGAYYIIGLPMAYILGFHFGMRGTGLMTGLLCGVSTQTIAFLLIAGCFTDWEKQAENAMKRIKRSATLPLLS